MMRNLKSFDFFSVIRFFPIALLLLSITLSACAGPVEGSTDSTRIFEEALLTATFAVLESSPIPSATQSPTPLRTAAASSTPEPSPTASPTEHIGPPPELPEGFISDHLRGGTLPQNYIEDSCSYLKARWDSDNSSPGTVVMPVMFHGVVEDSQEIDNPMNVHHSDMVEFIERARSLGFETITTQELVDFLENNARIPALSLILIVDDRRPGAVREHFMPYLEQYDWTLTLGWLIGDTDIKPASYLECCPWENFSSLWEQMEAYNATGYLDIQSHGNIHNINITGASTDEYILSELNESRRIIQEHFYCKDYDTGQQFTTCDTQQPLAFIWPGGSFTPRAANLARENGYRIGFTINPRGPIMFNWIPQAETADAASPSWLPEGPVDDPLMTLPRYWSYDTLYRIDEVVLIARQAQAYAEINRQAEIDYYNYFCRESYGEIDGETSASEEQ